MAGSEEKIADVIKTEVENEIRNGEIPYYYEEDFCDEHYADYYILLDNRIYSVVEYDEAVAKGVRSPSYIYAYGELFGTCNTNRFLFYNNFLRPCAVEGIIESYLRKSGFTVKRFYDLPPLPNLKYYVEVVFMHDNKPQYLGVNIYDVDAIAKNLGIPQIVEKLGIQREITNGDIEDIASRLLIAGYPYKTAWFALKDYSTNNNMLFYDDALKVSLALAKLPKAYQVCYKWDAKIQWFVKTDCLKPELLS